MNNSAVQLYGMMRKRIMTTMIGALASLEEYKLLFEEEEYEELRKDIKDFSASILKEDKIRNSRDTAKLGRDDRWIKNVAKDINIHEATNLINDMK